MLFMHIHTHSVEGCIIGESQKGLELTTKLRENFQKAGVKCLGAYVAQHEHTIYMLLEADNIHGLEVALIPMTRWGTARLIPIDTIDPLKS